jgi:hypothetical protein
LPLPRGVRTASKIYASVMASSETNTALAEQVAPATHVQIEPAYHSAEVRALNDRSAQRH